MIQYFQARKPTERPFFLADCVDTTLCLSRHFSAVLQSGLSLQPQGPDV